MAEVRQAPLEFSEAKTAEVLSELLAGTAPTWEQQKYLAPISDDDIAKLGEDSDPSGIETREFESDLLFVIDGVALCVEVKAGSVTEKARSGNAKRLATDLEKTLKDGNEQADRLAQLIRTNRGVRTASAEWIAVERVEEIHSIIVMLDDMGPLSLSMNELAEKGIIRFNLAAISGVVRPSHTGSPLLSTGYESGGLPGSLGRL